MSVLDYKRGQELRDASKHTSDLAGYLPERSSGAHAEASSIVSRVRLAKVASGTAVASPYWLLVNVRDNNCRRLLSGCSCDTAAASLHGKEKICLRLA